jgi:hypothetical protein
MLQTIYQPPLVPPTQVSSTKSRLQVQYKNVAFHSKIISPNTFPELKNQNKEQNCNMDVKQEVIYKPYAKTFHHSKIRHRMQEIFDKYQNYQEYEINNRVFEEVCYYLYCYFLAITFVMWRWFV